MNGYLQKRPGRLARSSCVVPPGIEPGTRGFSVHCSTAELRYLVCFAGAKLRRLFELTKFFEKKMRKIVQKEPNDAFLATLHPLYGEKCVLSPRQNEE